MFADRKDAGQQLAKVLEQYTQENPIVLGMPRGGVVLAYEVAQKLHASLDVIVARKIGAPNQPELAIGAIAPNDIEVFNNEMVAYCRLSEQDLAVLVNEQKKEMKRRINLYRGEEEPINIAGQIVIIVDDGLATGLTALATIRSVRKAKPKKIILAEAVCAPDSARLIEKDVDELICLYKPTPFYAVGQWYQNFDQTTDDEVIQLLKQNREMIR